MEGVHGRLRGTQKAHCKTFDRVIEGAWIGLPPSRPNRGGGDTVGGGVAIPAAESHGVA